MSRARKWSDYYERNGWRCPKCGATEQHHFGCARCSGCGGIVAYLELDHDPPAAGPEHRGEWLEPQLT